MTRVERDPLLVGRSYHSEEILWGTVEVIIQGAVKRASSGVATIYEEGG